MLAEILLNPKIESLPLLSPPLFALSSAIGV